MKKKTSVAKVVDGASAAGSSSSELWDPFYYLLRNYVPFLQLKSSKRSERSWNSSDRCSPVAPASTLSTKVSKEREGHNRKPLSPRNLVQELDSDFQRSSGDYKPSRRRDWSEETEELVPLMG